jgi:murein DD-endopeptidase MepM/ murein hydrolase activator NlpD
MRVEFRMNIILYSKRLGGARQFELNRPWIVAVSSCLCLGALAGVFMLGLAFGSNGMLFHPTAQLNDWTRQLATQRVQIADSKRQVQERLDALASRVGQMNAHVIRLDALGKRLTEMSHLDKGEFDFDHHPAQGGPEGLQDTLPVAAPDLTGILDNLTVKIKDRERQLGVLETLIVTRNLSRKVIPDGRPIAEGWISSYFGSRVDPFNGHGEFHRGLDFATAQGTQVMAAAAGLVTWSRERFGYGNTVEINHGNGYVTRYAHNQKLLVDEGQIVQKGQPISLVGSTGRSTGPHLHFEVLKDGHQIDPAKFVRQ